MHMLILGGSGRNGQLIIQEALSRGHSITALVRDPSALSNDALLTVIQGSPLSQDDIRNALLAAPSPPTVIVSALANHRNIDAAAPADFLESSARALVAAIKSIDLPHPPKLVINSSQGVCDSFDSLSFVIKPLFRHTGMSFVIRDHEKVDALVRQSGLPFVMARPGLLTEGQKPLRDFSDAGKGAPWFAMATRGGVAKWMVDACETEKFNGRAPVLAN